MAFEILEYAANVRQRRIEVTAKIKQLRHKYRMDNWVDYEMAVQDVMASLDSALDSASKTLGVIGRLVDVQTAKEDHLNKIITDYESQISAQKNRIDKYEQDLHRTDV